VLLLTATHRRRPQFLPGLELSSDVLMGLGLDTYFTEGASSLVG